MARLEERLSREKYWDQTAYNEEIFFPSHGTYQASRVRRILFDCCCVVVCV
jgi:hypothetical protein